MTLTDEQLNEEICKWRGWTWQDIGNGQLRLKLTTDWNKPLPSHILGPEALGNMMEVEKGLTKQEWRSYFDALMEVTEINDSSITADWCRNLVSATARQRAIALLQVVKPELFK